MVAHRRSPPEHDEDADYVIISTKTRSQGKKRFHLPAKYGVEPACTGSDSHEDTEWVTLSRSSPRFRSYKKCGHCKGRIESSIGGPGQATRKLLLDADPEDFGLDPLPDPDGGDA